MIGSNIKNKQKVLFELLRVELGPLMPAGPRDGLTLRRELLKTSES